MGDQRGILKYGCAKLPKRPPAERVRDYQWVYEPMPLSRQVELYLMGESML